jgi:hypothetical protein
MRAFLREAEEWSAGKQWQPRAALLLICGWIFYRHLQDPMYGGIVKGLNLAIHEIGHVLFGFVGEFIGIMGGTILQIAVPIISAWMFYRQRDFFAIAIALCWLGTSFFDVAVYAADARAGDLPLVGLGGGDPEHDWFIMLAETDLLNHDKAIGGLFRALGIISFVAGISFGTWLLRRSAMSRTATVVALFLAISMSGCSALSPFKGPDGLLKASSMLWKPVSAKRDPAYSIAVDGTECTVPKKRYDKIKIGDNAFCVWSSPVAGR